MKKKEPTPFVHFGVGLHSLGAVLEWCTAIVRSSEVGFWVRGFGCGVLGINLGRRMRISQEIRKFATNKITSQ